MLIIYNTIFPSRVTYVRVHCRCSCVQLFDENLFSLVPGWVCFCCFLLFSAKQMVEHDPWHFLCAGESEFLCSSTLFWIFLCSFTLNCFGITCLPFWPLLACPVKPGWMCLNFFFFFLYKFSPAVLLGDAKKVWYILRQE